MDYAGDATRLKDALRCCSVVPDLAAISVSYAKLEELERAGEIRILTVKNRFLKGEELPSGYRDVNVCVEFQGFLAEVQVTLQLPHADHSPAQLTGHGVRLHRAVSATINGQVSLRPPYCALCSMVKDLEQCPIQNESRSSNVQKLSHIFCQCY